ncbi:MAG: hypothetical protein E6J26_10635 [Chloroflexi bacterium]|nr:MAG: hypothetical protein E6J26_10635 [Chloroflexota bacterium]
MAGSAHTNLAGLERQPVALAYDGHPARIGRLPAQRATRRHKGRHRAVGAERDTAGRSARVGRIVHGRVMQELRQHAAARPRRSVAKGKAADLIGLEELDVRDVVEFAGGAQRLHASSGDAEVERLLGVGSIARSDVAADDDGEIVLHEVLLDERWRHARTIEGLLFGQRQRRRETRGLWTGTEFDGL